MSIYIWKISWSQFTQSILAKVHEAFCAFYEFVLVYILNLEVWTSFHPAIFFFRTMLGYSAHVSVFAIWQTSWDTAVGSFFVTEAICYSPSGDVLFGEDHLLCKWTYTTLVICVVSFRVICWSLSFCSSFISFLSPFPSSTVLGLETVSVAVELSPFVICFSVCGYCYRCYIQLLGYLRVLIFLYPVVSYGLFLWTRCILPFMTPSSCATGVKNGL